MPLSLTDINVSTPDDGLGTTLYAAGGIINGNNTAIETDANTVLMTALIETPANKDYVLYYDAPFAGTITSIRAKTEAGTCTVTGKIENVALGGTANSATTTASTQNHSTSNAYSIGDTIKVTLSDVSSAENLSLTLTGIRT